MLIIKKRIITDDLRLHETGQFIRRIDTEVEVLRDKLGTLPAPDYWADTVDAANWTQEDIAARVRYRQIDERLRLITRWRDDLLEHQTVLYDRLMAAQQRGDDDEVARLWGPAPPGPPTKLKA